MKTVRGVHITTDGEVTTVDIRTNLAELQAIVGGHLECLTLWENPNIHMYLNEEGKLDGLAVSELATLVAANYIPGFARHDFICGDVILLGGTTDGEEADLPVDVFTTVEDIRAGWAPAMCSANVGGDPAGGCENDALRGSDLCARHAEEAGER